MPQKSTSLFIFVNAGPDSDNQERDELARQLVDELTELDTVSAELAQGGELPQGAKGDPITIGTVLVTIAELGGITGLFALLGSWLSRDERRTVILQIGDSRLELAGISKQEQANLIQWFQTQAGLRLDA